MEEHNLSHDESLKLINSMINKAKNSYHDTGIGPILWGSVISVCALVTYFDITLDWSPPFDVWWLTLIAVIPQMWIVAKEKKLNMVRSYDEIVMDYVWTCFGIGIGILILINMNIFQNLSEFNNRYEELAGTRPAFRFSDYSTSYFLLWYGFPTIVTAGFRKFRPMMVGGIFCWIAAIVAIYTNVATDMLLTAASALLAWLIPGIILWRKYCERKSANV
jgi:hypothetical protein